MGRAQHRANSLTHEPLARVAHPLAVVDDLTQPVVDGALQILHTPARGLDHLVHHMRLGLESQLRRLPQRQRVKAHAHTARHRVTDVESTLRRWVRQFHDEVLQHGRHAVRDDGLEVVKLLLLQVVARLPLSGKHAVPHADQAY